MDELAQAIAEQTGLPEAQARQAAEAALNFLKQKLPAPLAGQVETVLENPALADRVDDIFDLGKSFFNKREE